MIGNEPDVVGTRDLDEDGPLNDPKRVKDAKTRTKLARKQEDADLLALMQSPMGRRFVLRLIGLARLRQLSFVPNSHPQTCFNEGVRSYALWLLDELDRVCPDLYLTALQEAQASAPKETLNA